LYGQQADAIGLGRGTLDAYAASVATPDKLQKKAAERRIDKLRAEHGAKWMEEGAKFTYQMPGEPQPITFETLLKRDGRQRDQNAAQAPTGLSPIEGTSEYAIVLRGLMDEFAEKNGGRQPTASERIPLMERANRLAAAPADPELANLNKQIAELRLQTIRNGEQAGRSPREIATFNQIAGAYERSPLIRAADRTIVLSDAVASVERNPRDAASQLNLAYGYIQALDTYQSAVREGELTNLGVLGTRLENWRTQLNRVATEGAFLPPEVARAIAASAKQLVRTIESGRNRKQQEFRSRAKVSGVGDMWDQFAAGFGDGAAAPPPPGSQPAPAATPATTPQRANPFRR
jgi:hypothetical protein